MRKRHLTFKHFLNHCYVNFLVKTNGSHKLSLRSCNLSEFRKYAPRKKSRTYNFSDSKTLFYFMSFIKIFSCYQVCLETCNICLTTVGLFYASLRYLQGVLSCGMLVYVHQKTFLSYFSCYLETQRSSKIFKTQISLQ